MAGQFHPFDKDLREVQFAFSLGHSVVYDDRDASVVLVGIVIDRRINHNYHPNENEILVRFGSFTEWVSIYDLRITITQEVL